jgi:hypothetical protein
MLFGRSQDCAVTTVVPICVVSCIIGRGGKRSSKSDIRGGRSLQISEKVIRALSNTLFINDSFD